MNFGDRYKHFKGGEYIFNCIAVPMTETHIIELDKSTSVHTAKHTEKGVDIKLFDIMGITIVDWHEPLVIYQKTEDYYQLNYWARPADDFFGYKEQEDGELVKRFTKLK